MRGKTLTDKISAWTHVNSSRSSTGRQVAGRNHFGYQDQLQVHKKLGNDNFRQIKRQSLVEDRYFELKEILKFNC